MKKISLNSLWFFVAIITIVSLEFMLKSCSPNDGKKPVEDIGQELKISSIMVTNNIDSINLSTDLNIPKVIDNDTTTTIKINTIINEMIQNELDEFMENINNENNESDIGNNFTVNYDVFSKESNLLSIRLSFSIYNSGAAHPNSFFRTINYNLNEQKKIMLSDPFKYDVDHLLEIATKVRSKAVELNVSDDQWLHEGTEPNINNYSNYNFTDSSILITFPTYQVAPYAAGPIEIELLFAELDGLNKEFSKK